MDMIDIKIENGRFVFDELGDIVFVKGAERVRQQVEFRLSLWAGEWFLDETFGTPYLLRVLGKSAVTVDAAVDALRQQILDIEGVQSINKLDYTFDPAARKLSIDVDIQSVYGLVTYQSAAQLEAADKFVDRTAIDMRATALDPRIVVNANPPHGIRTAGNYLMMTADGDYPVEMVNNVQVGRQLPMVPFDAVAAYNQKLNQVTLNTNVLASPGEGVAGQLLSCTVAPGEHYLDKSYSIASLQVGDSIRVEVMIKQYDDSACKFQLLAYTNPGVVVGCRVNVNPATGQITGSSGTSVKHVKVVAYGGGWYRVTASFVLPADATEVVMRYMLYPSANPPAEAFVESVYVTEGAVSNDTGTLTSIRGDGVLHSPGGSVSVLKMYGATGVRVLLSNNAHIDLDFGDADHVDLPANNYDVGDAYITRIEYRG